MTILITLENPERTGAPRMALQYARALVSAGHRVLVASGPPSEGASSILAELEGAGVEVRRIPPLTPRTAVTVLRGLHRLVRRHDIVCLIGFQQRDRILTCLLAGLTGTRCVISAQNQHVFRGGPLERRVKERIYGWALRGRADLVCCASKRVEAEVRNRFSINGGRTMVLPNGIDVQAFPTFGQAEARSARRELGVADDEVLLLNVGRIDSQKGQDLLLEAFGTIAHRKRDVRLALVGGVGRSSASEEARRYEDRLRGLSLTAGLDGKVVFLGWREDVPRLLAAADIYVHPSRWEGWPVAVVEAMAAGLPVVSSDCWGRPEGFVDGEHGWIVPTGDVRALEDALELALATDVRDLRNMGARGRSLAERHYDIRRLGRRFVQLLEKVVAP
jgi:glycosyltransferase involved in cell wall biosynthesis